MDDFKDATTLKLAPTTDNQITILSLASTVAILAAAYGTSLAALPKSTTAKLRVLFIWHAFDALIHGVLEGGYLYNCFFTWSAPKASIGSAFTGKFEGSPYLPRNSYFLGHNARLYGADYGTNPLSLLWQEYARADARWGGTDLTIISLELLTVFLGVPCAAWVCYCIARKRKDTWFWTTLLATGELYGGFMTFAPEWLTGNPNLDTEDPLLLWVYLVFFNCLWVVIPLWILYEGYSNLTSGGSGGIVGEGVDMNSGPASAVGKRPGSKKKD